MNDTLNPTITLEDLRQHELIILRRLARSPLTEFELCNHVVQASSYSPDQAAESMDGWLEHLQAMGFIWFGKLTNNTGQTIGAAALTRKGRELVG